MMLIRIVVALSMLLALAVARADHHFHRSGSGPSLGVFQDRVYVAYQSADRSGEIRLAVLNANRAEKALTLGSETRATPALAEFQRRLWIAFLGRNVADPMGPAGVSPPTSNLYIQSFDGASATRAKKLKYKSQSAPALVVYKGRLHMIWRDGSSKRLKTSSSGNGLDWTEVESIPDVKDAQKAPAAAVLDDTLHIVYVGKDDALKHVSYDGSDWTHRPVLRGKDSRRAVSHKSPAMSVLRNRLYVLRSGSGGGDATSPLYLISSQGADDSWQEERQISTSANRPGLVAFDDRLFFGITNERSRVPVLDEVHEVLQLDRLWLAQGNSIWLYSWRPETLVAGPTDVATERGPEIPPPSDVEVTRGTDGSVSLSWRDNSRVEQGFLIERGAGVRPPRWEEDRYRWENPEPAYIEGKDTRSILLEDQPLDAIVLCYRVRAYRYAQTSSPSRHRCAGVSR